MPAIYNDRIPAGPFQPPLRLVGPMPTPWRAPAVPALAAALGVGAWWAWCTWRRRKRQDGPWLLRGVTILDDLSPTGYREVDVLLGPGGRIDLICAPRSARRPLGAQLIDGSNKLLLPGFVNAHTHSSQMLGRGLVSPLPLDLWILQMLAVTGAAMDKFDSRAQAAYVAALFCGVECLMSGCTALQDHCFVLSFAEAEAACKAYKDLGLRVFFAPMLNDDKVLYENYVPRSSDAAARNARGERGGLGPEGSWRTEVGASDEAKCRASLALWEECAQKLHDPEHGVNIVIGPVSLYSCSTELLKGATELRKKYQLNGHTHVLESRGQKLEATRRFGAHGGSAVSFLQSTGFLEVPGTTTSLAHCCWLEESEMQIIAQHHAAVVHNPVSNLRLGSGVCHVRRNLCNDVTVSLGVDGAMSSDGQPFSLLFTPAEDLACYRCYGFMWRLLGLLGLPAVGQGQPSQPPERCEAFGGDFYRQSVADFAPFHNLSLWDAQRAKNHCRVQGEACFVVQIQDGQIYILDEKLGFQSRNRLSMAMLQRMAAKFGPLPDAEFVVDTSDGYSHIEGPIFVIAKFPSSPGGILYPDFSSYAWPESECPSEAVGSHVWARAAATISRRAPGWKEKSEQLFWRGAATSSYRKQVVPDIAALPFANVSVMTWVVGSAGQRQVVSSGDSSCVPIDEWCQHKYLANLPGHTMALALKYRLLCGSVVVSSPLMYHEWYYSQLKDQEHFVSVDFTWSSASDVLAALRANPGVAEGIGARAREWAESHLTEDGFDCYWLQLIRLAHQHFPAPQLSSASLPIEAVVLGHGHHPGEAPADSMDVITVIPARAKDLELMDYARSTWLGVQLPGFTHRHFFIMAAADPDIGMLRDEEDLLLVDCPHGYRQLMQKMVMAYRLLLDRFQVKFFIRADVDSVLPLEFLLPLLPRAANGQAVVHLPASNCGDLGRWRMPSIGYLQCQIECAMDRRCHYFQVDSAGDCTTFTTCTPMKSVGSAAVFKYALREMGDLEQLTENQNHPFILGTILHGNKVLINDSYNPQWNNLEYSHDLGLSVYPPYPEASGYAMSADIAAFLASVGVASLAQLQWNAWAIEDSALGTILAGLRFDLVQMPTEVREHVRDMTEAIKLACLLSTLSNVDYRQWLTAKEALKLASEGGYAAMGMQGVAGKIEVGCVADVTLWDLTAMSLLPRGDPASLLVLGRPQQGPCQAGSALHSSFVRGRRVVSGGIPLTCDLRRLRQTLWRHTAPRCTGAAALDPLAQPSAEMQRAAEVEYRGALGLDGTSLERQLSSTDLALRTVWDYAGACLPSRSCSKILEQLEAGSRLGRQGWECETGPVKLSEGQGTLPVLLGRTQAAEQDDPEAVDKDAEKALARDETEEKTSLGIDKIQYVWGKTW
eukprot:s1799_g4.t1